MKKTMISIATLLLSQLPTNNSDAVQITFKNLYDTYSANIEKCVTPEELSGLNSSELGVYMNSSFEVIYSMQSTFPYQKIGNDLILNFDNRDQFAGMLADLGGCHLQDSNFENQQGGRVLYLIDLFKPKKSKRGMKEMTGVLDLANQSVNFKLEFRHKYPLIFTNSLKQSVHIANKYFKEKFPFVKIQAIELPNEKHQNRTIDAGRYNLEGKLL